MSNNCLWYRQPAKEWVEALPVGNGRLGAMVFGGINQERIQLNEDSVWSGQPIERENPEALGNLPLVRELLFAGQYVEAEKLVAEKIMGLRIEGGIHTYQTLGDLILDFSHTKEVTEYRRSLDLDTAIATVEYHMGDDNYRREMFVSAVDQAIVIRLTGNRPITNGLVLSRLRDARIQVSNQLITLSGQAIGDGGEDHAVGVDFVAKLAVQSVEGQTYAKSNGLKVEGASSITLLITAATSYRGQDPDQVASQQMARVVEQSYTDLRARHIEEHQRLFQRVQIDLGTTELPNLSTDERLEAVKQGGEDPLLLAQYFQFGRYLLMSSSRPGSLPSNLQGLWEATMNPPWNADYHININIQMNYWPAEVCNLAECHQPFFDFIDRLRVRGRITAEKTYGCRGFVAHHTTDALLFTSAIGHPVYGMWSMGAGWSCRHLWEHFLYGGDQTFLAETAYPIMKEAALFFVDYLSEDPATGQLLSGPSSSPENSFRTSTGEVSHLVMGCTMDHQIIRDSFNSCVQASRLLDIDRQFRQQLEQMLAKLAPNQIGSDGRLMEWTEEFEEPEPGHRHISHLFGLHPGDQISPTQTPDLAEACRQTLAHRLRHGGGHTGWSRAWMINFYARLLDGNTAYHHLLALLRQSTHLNLFDDHPPFQIDGNFGGCAGLAEMLLQSQANEIHLLPALPDAWPQGSISGLRARGGFEVDIAWRDGKMAQAMVKSKLGRSCQVRSTTQVQVSAGGQLVEVETVDGNTVRFQTQTDGQYRLDA